MSYIAIARKYRPSLFKEVAGQDHIVRTLTNAIQSKRISHAYMFIGPRGVGKTSVARILAKALNCAQGPTSEPCGKCSSCTDIASGSGIDVIEIDAASNRKVEEIKTILDNVQYLPAESRYKVYIIDEVHMLSTHAFNALLKILEEPPSHVVFIFATTEPSKIPDTIHSRCQRFIFKRITPDKIVSRLIEVTKAEGKSIDEQAAALLARAGDGSMRDAQSLLDQVIAYSGDSIGIAEVEELTGALEERLAAELINSLAEGSFSLVLDQVSMIEEKGADFSNIMKKMVRIFRDALIYDTSDNSKLLFSFTDKEILSDLSERYTHNEFVLFNDILSEALAKFRFVGDKRVFFEFTLYKISHSRELFSCEGKNPAPAASSAAPAVKKDKLPSPAASGEFSWKESVLKASSMTLAPVIEEAILKENKKGILYIGWEKEYFYNQGEKKIREITDAVHKIDPHKEFKLYHIKKKEHKYEVKEKKPKDHRISEKILDFKNTFDGEIVGQRRNKDV